MLPKRLVFSAAKRISLGITSIGSTAWLLWPQSNFEIKPDAAIATFVAIAAWLGYEVTETFNQNIHISKHDNELFSKIVEILSNEYRNELLNRDFGNAFEYELVSPLHQIADRWIGKDFEFDDKSLDEIFKIVKSQVLSLSEYIAINTFSTNYDPMMFSFRTEIDKHQIQDATWDKIHKANNEATQVCASIDTLIKRYRKIASIMESDGSKLTMNSTR